MAIDLVQFREPAGQPSPPLRCGVVRLWTGGDTRWRSLCVCVPKTDDEAADREAIRWQLADAVRGEVLTG